MSAAIAGADAEVQIQRVTAGVATNLGAPAVIIVGTVARDATLVLGLSALTVAERTIPRGSGIRALVGGGNTGIGGSLATVSLAAYTVAA